MANGELHTSLDDNILDIKASAIEIVNSLKRATQHNDETLSDIFEINIEKYLSSEDTLLKDTNKIIAVHERLKKYA